LARRSDHSKEEIKALAINHAYKLIEEKGEDGFKARDIAKRMGYTVGTIYYVFDNMENLRLHVCAKILDSLHSKAIKDLPKKKNKINFHITNFIEYSQKHSKLWLFLYSNSSNRNETPLWFLEKLDGLFLLYAEAFYPHTKNKKEALKAAHVILASMYGMCILAINSRPDRINSAEPISMAKHLAKTYLKGLHNS